jgi:hypothetical protein
MGDILSALCDIKNVSHAHRKDIVRYCKVSHAFLEKCRTTLDEYRTPSWEMSRDTFQYRMPLGEMSYDTVEVSHALRRSIARTLKVSPSYIQKCRATLFYAVLKCRMVLQENLRGRTAGTFLCVLNLFRMALDTLLGVLRPYVVAFLFWWFLLESNFRVSVVVLRGLKYIV